MKVYVESRFACAAAKVWAEVQKPSLLIEVIKPLAGIRPIDPPVFPSIWEAGKTYRCFCWILGVIPIGVRSLTFLRVDATKMEIETRETDWVVRRWDHLITVKALDTKTTLYSDSIEIEAGLLTSLVVAYAKLFYRHRQKRWQSKVIPLIA